MRTTRFVSRDAIKMRRRRDENQRKLAMNLEHQLETNPNPSTTELMLEEAIQALSPYEQAGIVARFFEGKDFPEIAEMFDITEDAARKRTSRCLAKLQTFMEKRGAKVSLQTLSGMLVMPPAPPAANLAVQSAIQALQAAWHGNAAAANALALANHAARLLRRRFLTRLSLKIGVPVLILLLGLWMLQQSNRSASTRIENQGQAWGAQDQFVAQHRQFLSQTPPTAANYQATVQQELGTISRESSRIIIELSPLLTPPNERAHLAVFLTAGLGNTLNLDLAIRWRSRKVTHFCSFKLTHPPGGVFPFQVGIMSYGLWCFKRCDVSDALSDNDKFRRLNTTMTLDIGGLLFAGRVGQFS